MSDLRKEVRSGAQVLRVLASLAFRSIGGYLGDLKDNPDSLIL